MKKIIALFTGLLFIANVSAQTWKVQVCNISDISKTRTVKLKPNSIVTLKTLKQKDDTLTHSLTYKGIFSGVENNSMKICMERYNERKSFSNGIFLDTYIPGKQFVMKNSKDTGYAVVPIADIDYLKYNNQTRDKIADYVEPLFFATFLVSFISPFICIDYKDGSFNAERYKYWGIGCTIALAGSVGWATIMSKSKKFQFETNWYEKNKKVWSFCSDD